MCLSVNTARPLTHVLAREHGTPRYGPNGQGAILDAWAEPYGGGAFGSSDDAFATSDRYLDELNVSLNSAMTAWEVSLKAAWSDASSVGSHAFAKLNTRTKASRGSLALAQRSVHTVS